MLPEYVETLLQMSASGSDIDLLKGEVAILNNDRVKLVRKLNRLKSELNPERYFDPAAQLADQQERLRFTQKIKATEENKLEVEAELAMLKEEEEEAHRNLTALKTRQDELHADQKTIAARLESARLANNEVSATNFEAALHTCEEDVKAQDAEVNVAEAQYQVIANKLEVVSEKLREIEAALASYQKNRDEIDEKLRNASSYINQTLQQKEVSAIEEVEAEIAIVDARLKAISNDPVMIADEIKALVQEGKEEEAIPFVERLINIVEAMPYANLIGTPELEGALKEANERKAAIESQIAGNDYTNVTSYDLVQARSKYLQNRIEFFEGQAAAVTAIIAELDNDELFHTGTYVASAKEMAEGLQKTVQEYEGVVKGSEKEPTLKRANLGRALSSKSKDLNTVESIYHAFVAEQRDDINIATGLETNLLTAIKKEISKAKEKLASLKGISAKKKTEKDIIAEARDQRMLEEVNDEIAKIERWSQYNISPRQMLAELTSTYAPQRAVEEAPVLEPIIPDAIALQDSVDLGTPTIPEIRLEEITAPEVTFDPQVIEPVVSVEAPVDMEQFEVPVVPVNETPAETLVVEPAVVAEEIPVAPFAGFAAETEPVVAVEEQPLPAFEEPVQKTPTREIHRVVQIEDIANIRDTSVQKESAVGAPLEQGTEYVGFTDYNTGMRVA